MRGRVGVGTFDVERAAGDLLRLCSRRLDIPGDELARAAQAALRERASLAELARRLEASAAAAFRPSERHDASDVAFALARLRAP